ncbi:hypothetical protein [Rhodobacteraceae bacterium DSL-40]|uniref:hypothetical protein n=1 Tax=Amaricoccus sp. B4 TaxID=3368557 RepID=UPI0013A6E5DD
MGLVRAVSAPVWLLGFIGTSEIAGALTRIGPWLAPLAALGLPLIRFPAIPRHIIWGEIRMWAPANFAALALSLFALRRKAPIAPRA